jgi:integrase
MASIVARKTKDGKTIYRVMIRRKGEKHLSAHFDKLGLARDWAQSTEAAIKEGRYFKVHQGQDKTVADLIERYLAEELPKRRPNGRSGTIKMLAWWKKEIGNLYLKDIRPSILSKCRDKLRRVKTDKGTPLAASTANHYLAAMSHAFTIAMKEWEWVEDNAFFKIRRCPLPRGRMRFLSDDERERLLAATRESESPYLHAVVIVAICTGARYGEIMTLRWENIDFERRIMRLEQTKNGDKRAVPLAPPAMREILRLREEYGKRSPWVFSRTDKKKPIILIKHWRAAREQAGLKDFRFHDLRHTAASYLAMNGASLLEIGAILGHRTLQMVQRYSHVTDQHTAKILEKMTTNILGN